MEEHLTKTEARQGSNRAMQWRTFVISTALTAILLFAIFFIFIA
ncbi:hypothetical protein [Parvularcula maris]|uniref:Uncharacterized protein n=1 Tax=Parvularcula maris TaxID=2965077 RepID=A0A9X2L8J5_9PROT|nr:hypothetical protein [Parvularcula maris]MCQ8185007.1 hypothetical protein [Parvularcula maris]